MIYAPSLYAFPPFFAALFAAVVEWTAAVRTFAALKPDADKRRTIEHDETLRALHGAGFAVDDVISGVWALSNAYLKARQTVIGLEGALNLARVDLVEKEETISDLRAGNNTIREIVAQAVPPSGLGLVADLRTALSQRSTTAPSSPVQAGESLHDHTPTEPAQAG